MKEKLTPQYKHNIFDLIEGYYISNLLIYLSEKKAFSQNGRSFYSNLSKKDSDILKILYDRTDIIIKKNKKAYGLNPNYKSYLKLQFHIDKFLKAYGRFNLTGSTSPCIEPDPKKFSQAFEKANEQHNWNSTISILLALRAKTILDLGSGPGKLLEQFCEERSDHRAYGIELNNYLYSNANARIRKKGLCKQIKLIRGNVMDFRTLMSEQEIRSVDIVTGSNIFNEFFQDEKKILLLLKRLRKAFKGKYLMILDYYGILNTQNANHKMFQHSYLHDIVQLFTGQGIPPENYRGWNNYYESAECSLLYVYEGNSDGINWFVHILQLE